MGVISCLDFLINELIIVKHASNLNSIKIEFQKISLISLIRMQIISMLGIFIYY